MSEDGQPVAGSICHHEIPSPDLEAQQAFYGTVFGWEFVPMGPNYVLFRDGLTGGGLDGDATAVDGGTICVIAVDEVNAALELILSAGGDRLSQKTRCGDSDDYGFYAYFRDPCGNKLGVWSRN